MNSKKIFLKIIIGIVAGIILNILPMYLIQYKLELPLFMDTLGSITVAFIFGGVPAIICATISQIIMFFVEHYASAIILIYVTTVYAAIGVVCLFRKSLQETDSVLNTIFIIFFISILMALCVSISGGIVNAICIYVQDITGYAIQDNAATSYFQVDLLKMGLSSIPTYILSRIPSNLIERPIITVISFGISVMYQKLQKSE